MVRYSLGKGLTVRLASADWYALDARVREANCFSIRAGHSFARRHLSNVVGVIIGNYAALRKLPRFRKSKRDPAAARRVILSFKYRRMGE